MASSAVGWIAQPDALEVLEAERLECAVDQAEVGVVDERPEHRDDHQRQHHRHEDGHPEPHAGPDAW